VVRVDANGVYGQGPELPVYRLWHPRDHVRIQMIKPGEKDKPNVAISKGSKFEIHEHLLQKH